MINFDPRCARSVETQVTCCKCTGNVVQYGRSSQNKQLYYCKSCKITQVGNYSYVAYLPAINLNIISLTKEGCGIRSVARLLKISATTVMSRIKKMDSKIVQSPILIGKTYEVEELRTFVRKKDNLIWVVSAFEHESGKIVSFSVGLRTNKTLKVVIGSLKNSGCKAIYIDKLNNYKSLIDKKIHRKKFGELTVSKEHILLCAPPDRVQITFPIKIISNMRQVLKS